MPDQCRQGSFKVQIGIAVHAIEAALGPFVHSRQACARDRPPNPEHCGMLALSAGNRHRFDGCRSRLAPVNNQFDFWEIQLNFFKALRNAQEQSGEETARVEAKSQLRPEHRHFVRLGRKSLEKSASASLPSRICNGARRWRPHCRKARRLIPRGAAPSGRWAKHGADVGATVRMLRGSFLVARSGLRRTTAWKVMSVTATTRSRQAYFAVGYFLIGDADTAKCWQTPDEVHGADVAHRPRECPCLPVLFLNSPCLPQPSGLELPDAGSRDRL